MGLDMYAYSLDAKLADETGSVTSPSTRKLVAQLGSWI